MFTIVALLPVMLTVPPVKLRFLALPPLLENSPQDNVFEFKLKVPADNVSVRVDPTVILSASVKTAVPAPPKIVLLKVTGKSNVLPFVVIVLVPVDPAKVNVLVPALNVIPEEK